MNWMYEPRGKYPDYDDGETISPPMKWYEILSAIPLFFIFTIYSLISLALYGFYYIAKKTYDEGELESPRLTITGYCLGAMLIIAQTSQLVDLSNHPFITFCSLIFIIYFTLAPLTGLGLLFLQLTNNALNRLKPVMFIVILCGFIVLLVFLIKLIT